MKYYFTFGQSHVHTVNGKTFDKDSVVEIEAESYGKARDRMFEVFGRKWARQIEILEGVGMEYYPRGVIPLES